MEMLTGGQSDAMPAFGCCGLAMQGESLVETLMRAKQLKRCNYAERRLARKCVISQRGPTKRFKHGNFWGRDLPCVCTLKSGFDVRFIKMTSHFTKGASMCQRVRRRGA